MFGSAQGSRSQTSAESANRHRHSLSLAQAEQGVKHMGLMFCCHGNLIQDVALARVRTNLLLKYLDFSDTAI